MENIANKKMALSGYSYHAKGGKFYKRMCRDYYMYDSLYLKANDRSLIKNLGVVFYVLGCIATLITAFFIGLIGYEKGFWASLGIGFLAYLVVAVLTACEDFVGEFFCKLQGIFTGLFTGYVIQEIAFKCSSFAELSASGNQWKMLGIYTGLCILGYICMSSFWKSGTWNLINPSHPCSFLNNNLQKFRKSYIEKTEAKLNKSE